jgi:hypothetical protein
MYAICLYALSINTNPCNWIFSNYIKNNNFSIYILVYRKGAIKNEREKRNGNKFPFRFRLITRKKNAFLVDVQIFIKY